MIQLKTNLNNYNVKHACFENTFCASGNSEKIPWNQVGGIGLGKGMLVDKNRHRLFTIAFNWC